MHAKRSAYHARGRAGEGLAFASCALLSRSRRCLTGSFSRRWNASRNGIVLQRFPLVRSRTRQPQPRERFATPKGPGALSFFLSFYCRAIRMVVTEEGWQSGLTRRTRNAVGEKSPHRFESCTLRSQTKRTAPASFWDLIRQKRFFLFVRRLVFFLRGVVK